MRRHRLTDGDAVPDVSFGKDVIVRVGPANRHVKEVYKRFVILLPNQFGLEGLVTETMP
jgi:hypothetical protein